MPDDEMSFTVKAPRRVFLFGEHSDYLGLEVISVALNYYIDFIVSTRDDAKFSIVYTDLSEKDAFDLKELLTYRHKRDYLRSAFNVLMKNGIKPKKGANITISGTIPIAAGLSSSSALAVASIMTFAQLAETTLTKDQIAQYAFEAEVIEFGESGGKMDHLASVYGGIIHVDFGEELALTQIQVNIPGLIIGDSLESKQDTVGDLKMIRTNVENGFAAIKSCLTHFNHRETSLEEILTVNEDLTEPSKTMTITTIRNRDLTREALQYLQRGVIQPEEFGSMIDRIHALMRDGLQRSTPKIEAMISAAKDAGALGCKINGSGGGGTMLAYAPGNEKQVMEAIKVVGGEPYIVKISMGATLKS